MQSSLSNRKKLLILIISCITICALVLGVVFGVVFSKRSNELVTTVAEPTSTDFWIDDESYYNTKFEGAGTQSSPYLIETAEQLAGLSYLVYNGIGTSSSNSYFNRIYFKQTANIDLSAHYWQPIGILYNRSNSSTNRYFGGNYDGGGYTISGLFTPAGSTNAYSYQGLFGCIYNAEIKNVILVDSYVRGYNYVGGIVGSSSVGSFNSANIINCENQATVEASNQSAGGIIGSAGSSTYILYCVNSGSISSNGSRYGSTGGISGGGSSESSVENSYNTGEVTGSGIGVGGIIGFGSANNCYNLGTISGTATNIGGITGFGSVTDCFNLGSVSGSQNVGAIRGSTTGTITTSYYGGASANLGPTGGSAVDENYLLSNLETLAKQQTFFQNIDYWTNTWDFETTWKIDSSLNNGFPTFREEDEKAVYEFWVDEGNYTYTYAGGSGTELDPYLIETPQQLAGLSAYIFYNQTSGTSITHFDDVYFKQTKDIDLSAYYWLPIGTSGTLFAGNYDGGNFEITGIRNFQLDKVEYEDYYSSGGLFGGIQNAVIQNVIVADSEIRGSGDIGAIVNRGSGTIINCVNLSSVEGSGSYVGGIIGSLSSMSGGNGSFSVINCRNEGNVIMRPSLMGNVYVGGVAGSATVINCVNTGTIQNFGTSNIDYVGGIAGSGTVRSSVNEGTVTSTTTAGGIIGSGSVYNSYNSGTITGDYAGGIIGYDGTVENCYNLGDVNGTTRAGGVWGGNSSSSGSVSINHVYNAGNVTGGQNAYTGGIVGGGAATISNAINIGQVTGGTNVSGILGYASSSTVNNSYYGGNCANIGAVNGADTDTSVYSDTLLADAATLSWYEDSSVWTAIWDFENSWEFVGSASLPTLIASNWSQNASLDTSFSGSGTQSSPYQISSAEELAGLASLVNSGNTRYNAAYYVQTADIDLSASNWVAIGTSSNPFAGHYDGGRFLITGLNLAGNADSVSPYSYKGLFGYVRGTEGAVAELSNIAITGDSVSAKNYAGALVGYAEYVNIQNVYSSIDVAGVNYVGGLVGYASNVTITNSYNKGSVSGEENVGGLIGGTAASTITNVANFGSVTGTTNAGAIIGENTDATLSYAYYGVNCALNTAVGSGEGTATNVDSSSATSQTWWETSSNWDATYAWDFASTWTIISALNDSLPVFAGSYNRTLTLTDTDGVIPVEEGWDGSGRTVFKMVVANHAIGQLPTPTLEGFIFEGWFTDPNAGEEYTADSLMPMTDLTLYPHWTIDSWKSHASSSLVYENGNYLISSAEDLAFVLQQVSLGNQTYMTASYLQTANIDLTGYYWEPIGTAENPFKGNYDGGEFTISGISLYRWAPLTEEELKSVTNNLQDLMNEYSGLFGYVVGDSEENRLQFKNIGITDSNISAWNIAGAIAGYAENVAFENCYNAATVTAYAGVGGLVGAAVNCTFFECWNEGDVGYYPSMEESGSGNLGIDVYMKMSNRAGGLVNNLINSSIDRCYNEGEVQGGSAGGLANITDYNTGYGEYPSSITNSYNTGHVYGMLNIGGIMAASSSNTLIDNCYNTGNIESYLGGGGIVGANYSSTITNCYNTGMVTGQTGVAGISGTNNGFNANISNCFNTGAVGVLGEDGGIFKILGGGIVGSNQTSQGASVSNCYYGGNASSQLGGVQGGDVAGQAEYSPTLAEDATTEEWFQNESNWNPDYPWNIGEDWFIVDGYPTLEAPITWLDDPSYYDHEYATGNGSEGNPYVITSNKELAGMAYLLLNYNDVYKTKHFKLAANVDMSEYFWVPIGTTNALAFAGHFDGGNYTITGLRTYAGWDGVGLFGTVIGTNASHAVIENLVMEDITISANSYGGGVVGVGEYIEISNCRVIGTDNILKGTHLGGVIGYAMNSEVRDSYNNGTIKASGDYLGGVVGYANLSQVENCYATVSASFTGITRGVVTNADSGNVGGLVGGAESSTIANCFNAGVTNGSWGISADGLQSMMTILSTGGIIGFAKTQAIVTDCYNLGLISCDIIANGGGIAGKSDGATIQNCYNKGSLTSTTELEGGIMAFGGIVGSPINSTILKCTNYADIDYYYGYAGGIAGMGLDILLMMMGGEIESYLASLTTTTIQNCYNYGAIETIAAGGIAGMSTKYNFVDCVNVGDVGFYDATENSGSQGAAGIAAMAMGENSFERCYNIGNITGLDYLAGIVSQIQSLVDEEYAEISLNHCFNAGTLNMPDAGTASGLVGYATRAILTISNSASVGDVVYTNTSNSSTYTAGILGLIEGYSQSITISNCLVDMDVSLSIIGNTNIVAGIARTISATTVSIENCAIKMNVNSSSTLADENISSFYYDSSFQPSDVVSNSYSLITNNTTGTENNVVLDNGGMDGNFVYVEGMFDGMAVPVNIYHIDGYITNTGILEYLQQTFNVQPFVAA